MNTLPLSLCLGGRAKNLRRGYQEDPQHLDMLQIALTYPVVVGPPTGTDTYNRPLSHPQVHFVHQRLGKCALLRGQCMHKF